MARNTQLLELLGQLQSELRESKNPAAGVNVRDTRINALNQAQEFLYYDNTWSFLNSNFDVTTQAGQQNYDLPVDDGKIKKVELKWGNAWTPLQWGIAGPQLTAQDPDLDQRADPVQRIDLIDGEQFRVWPLPASDGNTIRFWGTRRLTRLVDNDDRAILDDRLIVLLAAWDLAPKERKDSALQKFTTFYKTWKKAFRLPRKHFVLGANGGIPTGRQPPGYVRVAEGNRTET